MKKTLLSLTFILLAGVAVRAQGLDDALFIAENNYIGSAHTMGMANAVSSVGGDLGSLVINPAASAVYGYSQVSMSMGLSTSSMLSAYAKGPVPSVVPSYTDFRNNNRTLFRVSNFGATFRYDNGDNPLRSFVFGVTTSTTNDFNSRSIASGVNSNSSAFAEMATVATRLGITPEQMKADDVWKNSELYSYWDVIAAGRGGLINKIAGTTNKYVGCTELLTTGGDHYIPGALTQTVAVTKSGTKTDCSLNMSFNILDRIYVGANLGLPMAQYTVSEQTTEMAQVVEDFPVQLIYSDGSKVNTYFSDATKQHAYSLNASGIYGLFGVIALPADNLRLAFTFRTPTTYTCNEEWQESGSVCYANGKSYSGRSEKASNVYTYKSPWHMTAGISYVFGYRGLISVDYELLNYSRIRYKKYYDTSSNEFDFTNTAMQKFAGLAHNLRIGAEVNIIPEVSVRAGYSILTSPQKYYHDSSVKEFTYYDYINDVDYYKGRKSLPSQSSYYNNFTQSFCAGVGYNSSGIFFADLAVKYTTYPQYIYQPYYDYSDVYAPRISNDRSLWNVVMTLGLRF